MRINRFVALATGISRREADDLIADGQIKINGQLATLGARVEDKDKVTKDGKALKPKKFEYLLLNKPVDYVCSQKAQGEHQTIYDLIPEKYRHLQVAGRLDYDSSGVLLLTNDGQAAFELTHPKFAKAKIYELEIDQPLKKADQEKIESGVNLEDGSSKLELEGSKTNWIVTMAEGRNRQIRRTFAALGYEVVKLHRTSLGQYTLDLLDEKQYSMVDKII